MQPDHVHSSSDPYPCMASPPSRPSRKPCINEEQNTCELARCRTAKTNLALSARIFHVSNLSATPLSAPAYQPVNPFCCAWPIAGDRQIMSRCFQKVLSLIQSSLASFHWHNEKTALRLLSPFIVPSLLHSRRRYFCSIDLHFEVTSPSSPCCPLPLCIF